MSRFITEQFQLDNVFFTVSGVPSHSGTNSYIPISSISHISKTETKPDIGTGTFNIPVRHLLFSKQKHKHEL